jgi:carbonic anhydrase/acetyltransferase-like protein (isoleucine patch superfamily)
MNKNLYPWNGKNPKLAENVYVAPGACIIGDVEIGEQSSVFFNAVLRGDIASIRIGERTNIQDNATIHLSSDRGVVIGNDVTIGHNAVVHACTIEDGVTIGMGAIIMDGARIRKHSIVGAGCVVTAEKDFPENSLILGLPARFVRELTLEEIQNNLKNAKSYVELIQKEKNNV